jgi:hypothetical protein
MVLAAAVVVGLVAGLVRSWVRQRPFRVPPLRLSWLVLLAFVPQWFGFYSPRQWMRAPDEWAPALLVITQALLLVFVWFNRRQPGFWLLGMGLLLNFVVILLNGGLMPISPETVRTLYPDVPESLWQIGHRLGSGKDIVLLPEQTNLWFLSDRFLLPDWLPFQVAFSIGDVWIAVGAVWTIWAMGGPERSESTA